MQQKNKKTIRFTSKNIILVLLLVVFLLSPISIVPHTPNFSKTTAQIETRLNFVLAADPLTETSPETTPKPKLESPFDCDWDNMKGCAGWVIYTVLFIPATTFMSAGGMVLDFMMAFSISPSIYNLSFVSVGWELSRDLVNMLFIFILLVISIGTILQVGSYNKNLLVRLIVVALLVNFSLFATRVIVDAGNITASFFHQGIGAGTNDTISGLMDMKGFGDSFDMVTPKNFSEGLAAAMEPQMLFQVTDETKVKGVENATGGLIIIFIAGAILSFLAGLVFFSVAFVFLSRVVAIWILMILAPFAFLAHVLPATAGYATKWWKELFGKSFCITVFMFFMWVLALFYQEGFVGQILKNPSELANFGITQYTIILTIQFGITLALLQFAKKQAQSMCGSIGGVSIDIGKKVAGFAGFVGGGFAGAALRRSVGAAARGRLNKLGADGKTSRRAELATQAREGKTFKERAWASTKLATMRGVEKSSMDFRGLGAALEKRVPTLKDFGSDAAAFGAPQVGGYAQTVKEAEKALVAKAKTFETAEEQKLFADIVENRNAFARAISSAGALAPKEARKGADGKGGAAQKIKENIEKKERAKKSKTEREENLRSAENKIIDLAGGIKTKTPPTLEQVPTNKEIKDAKDAGDIAKAAKLEEKVKAARAHNSEEEVRFAEEVRKRLEEITRDVKTLRLKKNLTRKERGEVVEKEMEIERIKEYQKTQIFLDKTREQINREAVKSENGSEKKEEKKDEK